MVTISFFSFTNNKWWAFKQMQLLPPLIHEVKGVKFSRFLGTGSGFGFSLKPDFSTYSLLIEWNKEEDKTAFFESSDVFKSLESRSVRIETYTLKPIGSHGSWYQKSPFQKVEEYDDGKIGVITRARINILKLPLFWKNVPRASRAIQQAEGLVFTKGIGEWPLIEQATFSVWENQQAMMEYAYTSDHKEIIQKVKKQGWYKEELFARFNLVDHLVMKN